jgi:hypothetical protein
MYFIQGSYYGVSFSITTTTGAVAAFIAASLLQAYDYKKRGYPIWYPLILAVGFAALLVYLRFFY